jgi:hypothetical protein
MTTRTHKGRWVIGYFGSWREAMDFANSLAHYGGRQRYLVRKMTRPFRSQMPQWAVWRL